MGRSTSARDWSGVAVLAVAVTGMLAPLGSVTAAPLPIRFEPNVGQAPPDAEYVARAPGFSVALSARGAVLSIGDKSGGAAGEPAASASRGGTVRLRFLGASDAARAHAEDPQPSVSNYFIGDDASKWHGRVANYGAVHYRDVYPAIDWVVYGNPRRLEYDWVIAPYGDAHRIRFAIDGADRVVLSEQGDLLITVGGRTLRQLRPVVHQSLPGEPLRRIAGRYVRHGRVFEYAVGDYDRSRELVIDPVLDYATYLGGSSGASFDPDTATGVAVDPAGNAYVTGVTLSTDFPLANALQATNLGYNAFIAKFDSAGELVYSTYLGGSQSTSRAAAIAVDGNGNVYVAGSTNAADFPTAKALQGGNASAKVFAGSNAFIAKIDTSGSTLAYSTYLGGAGADAAAAIAVDSAGRAYVAGRATSTNFPTVGAFQATNHALRPGDANAFVAVLDADGSTLAYSTYLGGSGVANASGDSAVAIAVDAGGSAYVTGNVCSTDFPLANAFQKQNNVTTPNSYYTAFVSKFDPTGRLAYSTYLGGNHLDVARAIAVDSAGNAYVAGSTLSTDFPVLHPFQSVDAVTTGLATGFVTKLNPSGNALVYSTFLGGSLGSDANAIAVDAAGDAFVAGSTFSGDFPTASPLQNGNSALQAGTTNGFLTVFNSAGSSLAFSTYLGGSGYDGAEPGIADAGAIIGDAVNAIAVGGSRYVYLAGITASKDFPLLNAYQSSNKAFANGKGGYNAFLARIDMGSVPIDPAPPNGIGGGSGGGALRWDLAALLAIGVYLRFGRRPRGALR